MAETKAKNKLPKGRHRDQMKRQRQNVKKTERNLVIRSEVRTFIKKVREAIAKKDAKLAKDALVSAARKIDKAVSSGIIHHNNGSRKISRLSQAVSALGK
jgi:small subunit ribosomal protein S20